MAQDNEAEPRAELGTTSTNRSVKLRIPLEPKKPKGKRERRNILARDGHAQRANRLRPILPKLLSRSIHWEAASPDNDVGRFAD
jgi:hypothetical protein